MHFEPVKVAIIGCGAITEKQYLPAIDSTTSIQVVAHFDPLEERASTVGRLCKYSQRVPSASAAAKLGADAVIIAAPANFHAQHSVEAMAAGLHVLCEKPIASTIAEAEVMLDTAIRTCKILSVGLCRRHYPTTKAVRQLIQEGMLGSPQRYIICEGGQFRWPVSSASFFDPEQSAGGVLHDLGSHTLDLILHWFGDPVQVDYFDDAKGGLETNCLIRFQHQSGLKGEVRLSRDWTTSNRYYIEFERGWVSFHPGQADQLQMGSQSGEIAFSVNLCEQSSYWNLPDCGPKAMTALQSFSYQLDQFVKAIRGQDNQCVLGLEAIRSLQLIETCYAERRELVMT